MSRNAIETVMGAVVLVIAGGFLYTAYKGQDVAPRSSDSYTVKALFNNVGGVNTGTDVRIGGVKIGVVNGLDLNPETYQAEVSMQLNKNIKLPKDTTAAIVGDGLLGSKFVSLEPGADDKLLKDGSTITFTQSSVSLEELIGKFVFSGGGVDGEKAEEEQPVTSLESEDQSVINTDTDSEPSEPPADVKPLQREGGAPGAPQAEPAADAPQAESAPQASPAPPADRDDEELTLPGM